MLVFIKKNLILIMLFLKIFLGFEEECRLYISFNII